MYLRNVQKLMAQFERQMAALDKHRGKGHQKVTIEPVHVHSERQAGFDPRESRRLRGRAIASSNRLRGNFGCAAVED